MTQRLFYEYAATPDILDAGYLAGDPRLEVIIPEFFKGICENGMLANLNRDGWIKHVENNCVPSIPILSLKDDIKRLLSKIKDRNRLVRHPKASDGEPVESLQWLKLALESNALIKFDGIVSSKSLIQNSSIECDEFIDCQKILGSTQWESRRRTLNLQSCEPYYRPVLDPVLRHAKSLTIVDPYFSPHVPKYVDFLKICIDQLGKRGRDTLPGRIHIHTGDPSMDFNNAQSVSERLASWEAKVKSLFPGQAPHKIKVFIRKKKDGGKKFHDRFILTDQCCIEIPMGTDTFTSSTPNSTTWSLLDYDDMLMKAQEIDPAMGVYDLIGDPLQIN